MNPIILTTRRTYGEIPEINGVSELRLINSQIRRQIQDTLNNQTSHYIPKRQTERLHLPEGVGLEIDYLA
ncbi:MAG: hypothetical protein CMH63_00600 [Nanoarchaeota archaeon]|jgi:hypothetical protein|nr:hypothetical protein [Nanoarchaeota archaeon]|tara:strand:+ start:46 stop:255 length:210 start_codon:yes stop_codon:yes gene_type:complete